MKCNLKSKIQNLKFKLAFGLLLLAVGMASASTDMGSATTSVDTRDHKLVVASAYGSPVPTVDTHHYAWKTTVTASVETVSGGYTCSGWTGTGAIPASGITNTTGAIVLSTVMSGITWEWTPNRYTVSFDEQGGTAPEPASQEVTFDAAYGALATASRTGYTFAGWWPDAAGTGMAVTHATLVTVAANHTLYAQWTVNSYTITFDSAEGTDVDPITQDYNTPVVAPTEPTRTGYTFASWEPALPTTMPAENLTLVAQWTANAYTITFDSAEGTAVAPITQDYDTAVTPPTDPTRPGYTFASWNPAVPATIPAEDLTLVAQWTANAYTLTFDSAEGTAVDPITQDYNTPVVAPTEPTRTGYTFAHWEPALPTTMPAENLTLVAQWTANAYTITFDSAEGTAVAPITQDYDTAVTPPTDPTRPGYTFASWNPAVPATIPAEDLTLVAQWTVNAYTLTFDSAEGSAVAAITQDYNTPVVAPTEPTRTGYTFANWEPALPTTMPAENLTLVAQWTADLYTITFDSAGGSEVAPITKGYETPVDAPADPIRIGYTFDGWTPDVPATMPAANSTLVAKWTINQYTISFECADGTAVAPITQDYGTTVISPAEPTRTGYTFEGWNPAIPATIPAENLTLTAQWTPNAYTITFDSAEGTTVAPITQDFDTALALPEEPKRLNYTFTGWKPALPAKMPAENLTLVAQWTIKQYTISFDSAGGTPVASIKQDYDTPVAAPTEPTRTGYTFASWSPALPAKIPADDLTVTAQWTAIQYTISFNSDGGTAVASITQDYGSPLSPPTEPTRPNYTFEGWEPAVPVMMPLGGLTVTAQWTPVQYTISFNSDGGTAVASITQGYNTPVMQPESPTRSGYLFVGWNPSVPSTMPGANVTVTAQWKRMYWLEAAAGAGGSVSRESASYMEGSSASVSAIADSDHGFAGWTGDVPSSAAMENPLWVIMDRDRSVQAQFVLLKAPDLGIGPTDVRLLTPAGAEVWNPSVGDTVNIEVTVRNLSAHTTPSPVTVCVYENGAPTDLSNYDSNAYARVATGGITSIAAGGSATLVFPWTPGGTDSIRIVTVTAEYDANRAQAQLNFQNGPDVALPLIEAQWVNNAVGRSVLVGRPEGLDYGIAPQPVVPTDMRSGVRYTLTGTAVYTWGVSQPVLGARVQVEANGAVYETRTIAPSGEWSIPLNAFPVGTYFATIRVFDGSLLGEDIAVLPVTSGPPVSDLRVLEVYFESPGVFRRSGDASWCSLNSTLTLKARVRNDGNTVCGPFTVAFMNATNATLATAHVASLQPNAETWVTGDANWMATPLGAVAITAVVDSGSEVVEPDEGNNTRASTVYVSAGKPDLIVTDIFWSPDSPKAGDLVTLTATVQNQGALAVPSGTELDVDFGLGRTGTLTLTSDLESDAHVAVSVIWTALAGNHPLTATADASDRVAEVDEGNNARTETLVVREALPDLSVTDIAWTPSSLIDGAVGTLTATVYNGGTVALPAGTLLKVRFDLNGVLITNRIVTLANDLVPGARTDVSGLWSAVTGTHLLGATVDSENEITEENEANNVRTESIVVRPALPDFSVTDIFWSPDSPIDGDAVTLTAHVHNGGTVPVAAGTVLTVRFDLDSGLMTNAIGMLVSDLLPGAGVDVSTLWAATTGTHVIDATVDSANIFAEENEANNVRTESVVVRPALPDLRPWYLRWGWQENSGLSFSPASPVAGTVVSLNLDLWNVGTVPLATGQSFTVKFTVNGSEVATENIFLSTDLPVGGSLRVSTVWDTVGRSAGGFTLGATVDSGALVAEESEVNNDTACGLTLYAAGALLRPVGLVFSPWQPRLSSPVTLTATIQNAGGQASAGGEIVTFYRDAVAVGNELGTAVLDGPIAAPGGTRSASFGWTSPATAGNVDIFAAIGGVSYNRTLKVTANPAPNLAVYSEDITITPIVPERGDDVQVRATVRNTEGSTATDFLVWFYVEVPGLGWVELGSPVAVDSLSVGAALSVDANTKISTDDLSVYGLKVSIEPNATQGDANLGDNAATTSFRLADAPVADAGSDRACSVGQTVTLDGTESRNARAYDWELVAWPVGSGAVLTDADTATPTLTPDLPGLYQVQLVVSDTQLQSDPDTVEVTASWLEFSVTSAHGTPVPDVGTHPYVWSAGVDCQSASVEEVGLTQYRCTGWIGTGSVPAVGTSTNISFSITNDSSMVWLWITNHWLSVETAGNGRLDTTSGWVAAGSNVIITATPTMNHHFVQWSGDTTGCMLAGGVLTAPMSQARAITATFEVDTYSVVFDIGSHGTRIGGGELAQHIVHGSGAVEPMIQPEGGWTFNGWDKDFGNVTNALEVHAQYTQIVYDLKVDSAHGVPDPSIGNHIYPWMTTVDCQAKGGEEVDGTRYLCTGWTGTGSVPASGITSNISFAITNDSTLVWNWATEYQLSVETVGGSGSLSVTDAWYAVGSEVTVATVADDGSRFDHWQLDGLALTESGATNLVTVVMDGPHTLTAVFIALDLPEALDNNELVWTTGGASNWFGQTRETFDGVDAAGSGLVSNNAQSWLETSVTNGGTLTFVWRVSSKEQSDQLRFTVDGHVYGLISGETGWRTNSVTVPYGSHTFSWVYAKGKSGAAGSDRGWVDQVVWTPQPPLTLAVAVDAINLVWTTEGDAAWFPQREVMNDGVAAAQSGNVGDYGWSCLTTHVRGSGVLAFDWLVSSEEEYDWLVFVVDGIVSRAITGETGWQRVQFVLGEGDHELSWEYWKDESLFEGDDAGWLDQVVWEPDPTGFARWAIDQGLAGAEDEALLFSQLHPATGIPCGLAYAFGDNLVSGTPMLNIRMVDGRPVVETPEQDLKTAQFVELRVVGTTDLASGDWTLPVVPAVDTTGKSANRAWYEPAGTAPDRAFFKLEARLKGEEEF